MSIKRTVFSFAAVVFVFLTLTFLTACGGGGSGDGAVDTVTVTGRFLVPNQAVTSLGLSRTVGDSRSAPVATISVVDLEQLPSSSRSFEELLNLVPVAVVQTDENGDFTASISAGILAGFITTDPVRIAAIRKIDGATIGQAPLVADSATTLNTFGVLNARADGNILDVNLLNAALRNAEEFSESRLNDNGFFFGEAIDFTDLNSINLAGQRLAADGDFLNFFATRSDSPSDDSNGSDNSPPAPTEASCTSDADTICALNNRFKVNATWADFQGNSGNATVGQTFFDGGFLFLGNDNTELLAQLLDRCGETNTFWVFATASTNVEFTLTVTDTVSNQTRTYSNPLGTPFQPIQDTQAFATCP